MTSIAETLHAPPRAMGRLALSPALAGGLLWLAGAAVTFYVPDRNTGITDIACTPQLAALQAAAAVLLLGATLGASATGWGSSLLVRLGPWSALLAVMLIAWEILTAKLAVLPLPFFAAPQSILEVYLDDWGRLGTSLWHSVKLLAWGYAIGAGLGVITGISIGWWQRASYWIHPVLRFIGPLPATAWLPVAFFAFPSSWSASVFLIALATGFPVTILTWSGIASVNKDYYDIARTLGASERFLVLKVAVPAALPHIFVGLFMGLGASFAVLVVAEMLGVKAGLGWYLSWAQVLNLLKDLQEQRGLTYLLISHDLAVVAFMASRIGVLYLGQFMEMGARNAVLHRPAHPYTQALIAAAEPALEDAAPVAGEIPSPLAPPQGCPFHPRCPKAGDVCRQEKPALRAIAPDHLAACHFAET